MKLVVDWDGTVTERDTHGGDGFSDRCAALAAERVFARDGLARYLDSVGVRYEPYTDFRDVARSFARARGSW